MEVPWQWFCEKSRQKKSSSGLLDRAHCTLFVGCFNTYKKWYPDFSSKNHSRNKSIIYDLASECCVSFESWSFRERKSSYEAVKSAGRRVIFNSRDKNFACTKTINFNSIGTVGLKSKNADKQKDGLTNSHSIRNIWFLPSRKHTDQRKWRK